MKKFIYSFMAMLCIWITAAQAQTNPCEGKANFEFTINVNTVTFVSINTSNTVLEHKWSFGDGAISNAVNPVHLYQLPGNYRVVHYIKDVARNCYDSAVKEIQLIFTPACELLQSKFEWIRDTTVPNRIKFINQSLPNIAGTTLLYKWNFGDGTFSSEKNPIHTYNAPGQYNVCLTIRYANANCEKTFCMVVTVPPTCNLQALFTWAADSANPQKIKFSNQTVVPATAAQVSWSFGDGTGSNEWSPTHVYTHPSVYKVCLKVYINNTCVKEICKEVVIRACTVQPNFTWTLDTVYPMRGVKFHNQTPLTSNTPPISVKWTFGDGATSNEWSPFHNYAQPGTYKVCLRIEFFPGCLKEICKEVTVPAPMHCEQMSAFSMERIINEPNTFVFKANVPNAFAKYTWTFGDGTGALGPNARHKYDRPGRYTVCLTVYRSNECASTTCKEVVIGQLNCEQTYVKFEYQRLNPPIGNAIKFTAVSNQPLVSQRWTIQKSNSNTPVIIHTNNPTYIFQDTGLYKVCLRAVTANGCVKEFCETIRIQQIPVACTLQVTPNPATTTVNFKVQVEVSQTVTASIIDITGVRKAIFYLNAAVGVNSFALPVSTLPAGYYTLEVKVGNRICLGRFQKIN
ncbi:MAG: PKD domain-containing protein [Chitinophagaceae bacterium]|nr:PKD domain-containing protein [Chitinophagaceae bacterium]